ncbi:hypothetical protein [Brevibacillus daliensis]|uniref:hypothetical protein n=1 Tax=Brevibacillus daliensis TaxID=2892995 RepID=UPI001E65AEFD|nr:hypothetical protein [Brevibacillus daliensis]
MNDNKLASNISLGSALAALVFGLSGQIAIAVCVVGLVASLSPNLRSDLKDNMEDAVRDLHKTRRWMERNSQIKRIEIEFPFMDYDDIRLITGKGLAIRSFGKGGWTDV